VAAALSSACLSGFVPRAVCRTWHPSRPRAAHVSP
jgi:hypothetical protein